MGPEKNLKTVGAKLPDDIVSYIDALSAKHDNIGRSYIVRQFLRYAIKEHKNGRLRLFE
jgi:metal-responsive CopG/Arc/MetJ family transcriptional regulator